MGGSNKGPVLSSAVGGEASDLIKSWLMNINKSHKGFWNILHAHLNFIMNFNTWQGMILINSTLTLFDLFISFYFHFHSIKLFFVLMLKLILWSTGTQGVFSFIQVPFNF